MPYQGKNRPFKEVSVSFFSAMIGSLNEHLDLSQTFIAGTPVLL
jgi:hypothetical protein